MCDSRRTMGLGFLCILCVTLFNAVWSSSVISSGLYADPSKAGKIFKTYWDIFFFISITLFNQKVWYLEFILNKWAIHFTCFFLILFTILLNYSCFFKLWNHMHIQYQFSIVIQMMIFFSIRILHTCLFYHYIIICLPYQRITATTSTCFAY